MVQNPLQGTNSQLSMDEIGASLGLFAGPACFETEVSRKGLGRFFWTWEMAEKKT